MPNRILREGILTSPRIARLSGWADEVFYRRLMSVVDDFGRYYADPGLLRAACYPRQLNKVSDSDVGKWLTACVTAALVRVYPAQDGERYLQLIDFRQQARAKTSRFPDPLSGCAADATQEQSTSAAPAPVFVFGGVSVSEGVSAPAAPSPAPAPKAKKAPETTMPADFTLSERVRRWGKEKGHTRLEEHFEAFCLKAKAKGYTYADWDAAFMGAVRENWADLAPTANGVDAASNTIAYLDERASIKSSPEATQAGIAALAALRQKGLTA